MHNFVVSHNYVIKFPQRAYQAWKMRNVSYGLTTLLLTSIVVPATVTARVTVGVGFCENS